MAGIQRRTEADGRIRWVVRWRNPGGTNRAKGFAKQSDAKRYAAAIEHAQATGSYVDPRAGRERFSTAAEEWHAGRVGLAPTTIAQHRSYLDSLILPTFGPSPLSEISTAQIRSWIAELDGSGRSPATIGKALTLLRAVLRQTVEDGKLPASPADARIELPRAPHREMAVLDPDQIRRLADEAGPFYRTHLLAAVQTGLRWGELTGLALSDVDLLRGEIRIRRQLQEIAGRLELTDRLKTETSRRTVTISRHLAELIGEHAGRFPNDEGLTFATIEGSRLRRSNFARAVLKPAAAAIGVPDLRFHDLRHTHASLLIAAGEPIPNVSKRLGHRNVHTTMRLYAHAIPGSERSAAERMGEIFDTIPTTVAGWRGQNAGRGDGADVLELPQTLT